MLGLAAGLVAAGAAGAAGAPSAPTAKPAIPTDERGLPLWQPRVWTDFPVRIELPDAAALREMLAKVPIADFDREQVRPSRGSGARGGAGGGAAGGGPSLRLLTVETRVTDAEFAALRTAGYAPARVRDTEREGREAVEAAWAAQAAAGGAALKVGEKAVYHTYAQIGTILQQTAAAHPAIAAAGSIGTSVNGRSLWSIEISDSVGVNQAEPEVRLAAAIHGNEPPDLEMLLFLVDYLTTNYGTDPVVTSLVDNYDVTIIPCLNPDGLVAGTRANAHGRDLNRNFPVPDGTIGDDSTWNEEVETVAVKSHGAAHRFVISQNGHAGSLVVNYPWDYTYDLTPDDAAIQLLSLEYSSENSPMYNSFEFEDGITNGAQWYVVAGSLQDWSYHATGCIDLTVEMSNSFAPPASSLDALWSDNRNSLLELIKAARYGVNGVVTDSHTGAPLAATVAVTGNSKTAATDPARGDYYKLLPTGTYELTFTSDGYTSQTIAGVATVWGAPTVLNVQLASAESTVSETPGLLAALRAQPNPFNPTTTLRFALDQPGHGRLTVHDVSGRLVRRLAERDFTAGEHTFFWNGADDRGRRLDSGVYFARLEVRGRAPRTAKMALVK